MATPALTPYHAAASMSLAAAKPAATPADSSSSSSSSSATISANDFLTLLVTEMQNQDPTADTDPNEYIDQLVNVNSLEQLIQINQTLSSAMPTSTSGMVHSLNQADAHAPSGPSATPPQPASAPPSPQALALTGTPAPVTAPAVPGNLSVPSASPAALRVAQALGSSRANP
jgi:flagellar basal-body rod modification protein FlgD